MRARHSRPPGRPRSRTARWRRDAAKSGYPIGVHPTSSSQPTPSSSCNQPGSEGRTVTFRHPANADRPALRSGGGTAAQQFEHRRTQTNRPDDPGSGRIPRLDQRVRRLNQRPTSVAHGPNLDLKCCSCPGRARPGDRAEPPPRLIADLGKLAQRGATVSAVAALAQRRGRIAYHDRHGRLVHLNPMRIALQRGHAPPAAAAR